MKTEKSNGSLFHFNYLYRRPMLNRDGFHLVTASEGWYAEVKMSGISGYPWYQLKNQKRNDGLFSTQEAATCAVKNTKMEGVVREFPVNLTCSRTINKENYAAMDRETADFPLPPELVRIKVLADETLVIPTA
jgi:hypothetical protein